MNLVFAAPANSVHTAKWVNAMIDANHQVMLFSMPDQKDGYNEISNKAEIVYLDVPSDQGGAKKNAKQLKTALSGKSYDVLVAMGTLTYGTMAAKAGAAHIMLITDGPSIYACEQDGTKPQIKKSVKAAACVCAASPNIITKVKDVYKKEQTYFVTPFGVDMDKFKKVPSEHAEPCIGSLKMLEPDSGVDLVIRAFKKYIDTPDVNAVLKIAGSGSAEAQLKKDAQELGIADKVEFLGYVKHEDMPGVINSMDIVVQMPNQEFFGVSTIEAMACEVPVVASDTVGSAEFILNGVTGYMVKIGKVDACADKMLAVMKDPAAREHMGKLCRDDVEPVYNMQTCTDKFTEALNYASKN